MEWGEWDADTTRLALHHDSLSRMFGAAGLCRLSTQHASEFKHALEKGSDPNEGKSSGSGRGSTPRSYVGSRRASAFAALPTWHQIHNQRCTTCQNALFVGLNCVSVSKGLRCLICKSVTAREEPDDHVKRQFRSVQCRQRIGHGKSKEEERSKGQSGEKTQAVDRQRDEEPKELTLQQRAASLRKKSQEQRKQKDQEGDEAKARRSGQDETKARLGDGGTQREPVKPDSSTPLKAKRKDAPGPDKEALRLLLAQKKKKHKDGPASSHQPKTGGLQDFLGSL